MKCEDFRWNFKMTLKSIKMSKHKVTAKKQAKYNVYEDMYVKAWISDLLISLSIKTDSKIINSCFLYKPGLRYYWILPFIPISYWYIYIYNW